MIIDEYSNNKDNSDKPIVTDPSYEHLSKINELMKDTVNNFLLYLHSDFIKKENLSEPDLTQTYITQATILIRKKEYPFNIDKEYHDIYFLSKGNSDFYFYPNEQGVSTSSIFSVESKRLPAPEKHREKEYVIGENMNGGIERYKIEKHGKGLDVCGMLGFIEKEESNYWLTQINEWIEELSNSDSFWNKDEILNENEKNDNYSYFNSISHRQTERDLTLYHLWVNIKN
ncbi:MAG TPA: hypothetical protein PKY56_10775 [Candidatus Kapabacteria bacterium]|nr:hypothetical protein [Candidatus Kapabacteria bacterium]HPO61821.1 hypothetical protein [Candidatus Kapabacteria bacterium]